jgi:Zn-dependent M28 family amino/carboxypeptidase
LLVLGLAMNGCGGSSLKLKQDRFDADRAMALVYRQVAVGQRPAGSPQLRHLATELRPKLPVGRFESFATPGPQQGLRNIVGVLPGRPPAIVIGAHYDTEWHPRGFVGANDSAAGTAAVIELARSLRSALPADHREIRFVLFDGEEDPPGCTDQNFQFCALRGSRAYAAAHPGEIGKMILLDYIANRRARIPREGNSSRALWAKLRQAALQVGAEGIFPAGTQKSYVLDDHVPFLERAVPSIDLIDFSFPFKDTVLDTPAYLDPAVLDAVGETVAQLVIDLSDQKSPKPGAPSGAGATPSTDKRR